MTTDSMFEIMKRCADSCRNRFEPQALDLEKVIYLDASNRMIDGCCCLFFDSSGSTPLLAAKAAVTAIGKAAFQTEFEILQQLVQAGMNIERQTVPEPLGLWEEGESLITLQSALPGTIMKSIPGRKLFSPQRISESLSQVTAWLYHFQKTFGVEKTILSPELYEQEVLLLLKRYCQRFLLSADEERFLYERFFEQSSLLGKQLPMTVRHGDFCPLNIMVQPAGIAVFDWEFPLERHLPFFDMFFFFSSLRFPFSRLLKESSHFEDYCSVFWGDNYLSREMRRCVHDVRCRYEISPAMLPDLFLVVLLGAANIKYEGLMAGCGMTEDADPDQQVSNQSKLSRWQSFEKSETNAPLVWITNGSCQNIRFLIQHGFPDFAA